MKLSRLQCSDVEGRRDGDLEARRRCAGVEAWRNRARGISSLGAIGVRSLLSNLLRRTVDHYGGCAKSPVSLRWTQIFYLRLLPGEVLRVVGSET